MRHHECFIAVGGIAEGAIGGIGAHVEPQRAIALNRAKDRIGIAGIALAAVAEIEQRGFGDREGILPTDETDEGNIEADPYICIQRRRQFAIHVHQALRPKLEILADLADPDFSVAKRL